MSLMDTISKTVSQRSGKQTGDMDILDKLKEEHDEAKALLKQLVEGTNARERKATLKKLKAALVPHLRAEEKVVYDAVLALKDKQEQQDGEEGYLEHDLGDRMLATLGKITNAMSPEFSAAAKVLKELVEHHVEEEERNIWAAVRDNFSNEDRTEMNRKFEAAKKKIRVH
jgi:iron-sulfur cluster repair protein YtfE (RIC family)